MSRYLSFDEIIKINAQLIEKFGGTHRLRDQGALRAAVARPQSGYYADVLEEAAALFESLSQNHPFIDGNKRTAFTATAVFLMLNGYRLHFDDVDAYEWLINLYEIHGLTKVAIEAWLRDHAQPL